MNESEKVDCVDKAGKSTASPTPAEDTDFDPTADMMIHDFDDETTLNDNEYDIETNEEELADLAKEGEMPLEELLALYYGKASASSNEGEAGQNEQENLENTGNEAPKRSLRSTGLLNQVASGSESSGDEDNRVDYRVFREEERKLPRVGEEYQVTKIPELVANGDEKPSENYGHEDERIWAPSKLPLKVVEEYLKEVAISSSSCSRSDTNSPTFIQDNEDALFLLIQSNYDPEEALRRYKSRPAPLSNEVEVWSGEECQEFENGLTIYGKDFFLIHMNKVRTKAVRDIVKFYYIWKKTQRYDHFTAKTRLGKKKELLPASVTDYMDRLLDETDHATTSSILNNTGAHFLKYSLSAHSAALIEHIKEFEGGYFYNGDHGLSDVVLGAGDGRQSEIHLDNSNATPSSSNAHREIEINCNNNNNDPNLHDIDRVVSELAEGYSGTG